MDKIQNKIGAICINFESLDLFLSAFIGKLISEDPKVGAIMTADLSYSNLVHAFSSLIKLKYPEDKNFLLEFDKLLKMLNESEVNRNQIVHSAYIYNDFENDKNNVSRMKVTSRQRHGLTVNHVEISESGMKEINDQILFSIQEIQSLYSHLFGDDRIKYA